MTMPESWQEQVNEVMEDDGVDGVMTLSDDVKAAYVVRSGSDPKAFHYVLDLGWIIVCTCDGFRYRTDCKHVQKKFGEGVDKGEGEGIE